MIAIHVLASLLALLGPLAVFVVVFGGWSEARSFLARGHFGSELVTVAYITTMVTLAVAGSFFVKKRRVPGSVLYAIACVPYLVALGYATVRHHVNVGWLTEDGVGPAHTEAFISATQVTESALAAGATASAFAMLIVALAALSHWLTHRSSASLVVASFGSLLLFASVAAHTLGRAREMRALDASDAAARTSAMTHGAIAMHVALVVGPLAIAIALTPFFVGRARRSNALLVMVAATCAAGAAPAIMAKRDDRFFRLTDPTIAITGVRVPETRFRWLNPTPNTRTIAIRSDGQSTLGEAAALPEDIATTSETFGLIADRDVTYRALKKLKHVCRLELYVRFTSEDRAAAAMVGEIGTYMMTFTVASFGFHDPIERSLSIVLDGATARVMRAPDVDITLPMAPDASTYRRGVFKNIGVWQQSRIYIAPRPNDTLAAIWQIAEDARAFESRPIDIMLTDDRGTPAERAAAMEERFRNWQ